MGVDIIMDIYHKGKLIHTDIFEGRNSEWFDNLNGNGYDREYDYFPRVSGPCPGAENIPDEEKYNYGFYHIRVLDFLNWYDKHQPYLHAGWVNKVTSFNYINKNIIPDENEVYEMLPVWKEDFHRDNYVWLAYRKEDPSSVIMHFISMKNVPEDAYIFYRFNR